MRSFWADLLTLVHVDPLALRLVRLVDGAGEVCLGLPDELRDGASIGRLDLLATTVEEVHDVVIPRVDRLADTGNSHGRLGVVLVEHGAGDLDETEDNARDQEASEVSSTENEILHHFAPCSMFVKEMSGQTFCFCATAHFHATSVKLGWSSAGLGSSSCEIDCLARHRLSSR